MPFLGAHLSSPDGIAALPGMAAALGASAFALYSGGDGAMFPKGPSPDEAARFREEVAHFGFAPAAILPHANLFLNLGAPDARKLATARSSFVAELRRCELLGLPQLNVHPGSHLGAPRRECLARIAESVNRALEKTAGVRVLLENAAGQGTNVGAAFEDLAEIMDGVEDKSRVGVCLDTCHAFAAGYNLATPDGYAQMWRAFDDTIGAPFLGALHLNDAQKPLGSRIDRHASLGAGHIGEDAFAQIMADARFAGLPLILETPDPARWPDEIAWLTAQGKNVSA